MKITPHPTERPTEEIGRGWIATNSRAYARELEGREATRADRERVNAGGDESAADNPVCRKSIEPK